MIRKLFRREPRIEQPAFATLGSESSVGSFRILEGPANIAIGSKCMIRDDAWMSAYPHLYPELDSSVPRIVIEDDVYIGFSSFITAIHSVRICEGALISDGFYTSDHSHGFDPREGPPRYQPLTSKGPVEIGKNCFLGYRVTVLSGVVLGRNCVVGAHSVVTRSFPDYSMLAGIPARRIKSFDFSTGRWIDCE